MPDAESGIFFEIVMNKNKIIVLLIALVAVFAYQKMQNKQPLQSQHQQKIEAVQKQNNAGGENADTAQQQTGSGKQSAEAVLKQAFENEQSDIQVEGEGTVWKTLPDDNKGTRHQRLYLEALQRPDAFGGTQYRPCR